MSPSTPECGAISERDLDPQHMIPVFQRHPATRFDMYHLGVPYVREAIIIGKNFPNVWLNMCWCHVISQRLACTALDEMIDLVPVNKIIAFGGDYEIPVEKVYGHLVMAREDVARVLEERVEEGFMTENELSSWLEPGSMRTLEACISLRFNGATVMRKAFS